MKTKLILRKNRIIGVIAIIFCIVLSGVVFQGCEKNEIIFPNGLKYFGLSGSLEHLTPEDLETLKDVKKRLEKFINITQGKFVLDIRSGNEIHISEELFIYYRNSISNTNTILNDDNYVIKGEGVVKNIVLIIRSD